MPGNDIHGGFATHIVVPAHGLCPVEEGRLKAAGLDARRCLGRRRRGDDALSGGGAGRRAERRSRRRQWRRRGRRLLRADRDEHSAARSSRIDVSDDKLEAIGADTAALTLNAREARRRASSRGASRASPRSAACAQIEWIIFECSGTRAGQETAFSLLNRGATLGVVGFTMDKVELRLSNLMAFHARALGNWGCPPELYPAALDLVLHGRVKVGPFVEQHPLARHQQGFRRRSITASCKRRAVLVPAA